MCPRLPIEVRDPPSLYPNYSAIAISFALDRLEPFEVPIFLQDFRDGNLEGWPEFFPYLGARTVGDSHVG